MKEEFNLHDPSEFLYLNSTETVIDGVDDMREFKKTIKSMDSIGFSSNDRKEIFRVVAGILHLGNIQFLEGNSKDRAEIVENDALKWASLCLGVQPNQLKHALLARTLNTEEKVVTFQTAVQARFNRDALAKGIYERLFLWIVQKINSVIKPKTKKMVTKIGILDLYGFEIYPSDNSLEQLNINFVNEKLQQHTLKLLQQEKDEYVKEGIFNMDLFTILSKELKKDFLSDFDTINDCISCIEDKPLGIYSLLDEEDYLNVSGDERYLAKLKENLKKSNSFEPARFKSTTFSLKHFAAKVDYNVTDWVKKNKDTLFKDLIDAMCKSSSDLVQELFKPLDDFYSGRESKRRLQETIVKQFKRDVNKLMNKKLKGKIHFIYCIKPNYEKKALKFDKKLITNQVKCLGLSSISIFKQHGFFFKMDYPKFFAKYKALSPKTWPSSSADFDIEELKSKIRSILAETKIEGNNYAFGKTEIFLKTPLDVATLIDRFEQIQEAVAVLIQRKYREVIHKRVRRKSEKIKGQLTSVHERIYSDYGEHNVVQITNGKSISRLLVISKTNICFLEPNTYELVFNFPLSIIYRLCMSRFSDGIFIICMRNFGDIILDVENKQHLYQDIESSFHKLMSSLLDSYKPISIEFHSIFYVNPSVLVLEDNEMKQKAEYEIFSNSLPRNSNGDYQHQINLENNEEPPMNENGYTVQFLKDYTIAAMKIERRPNNEGLIIYVKPNEDVYSGKKKRRQGSFDRYFVGDSLRWKEKLGEDRDILFSDLVDKYHKSFKKSERYLIITERSVYLEHKFLKKRRRIPLRKIYKISVSPFTDHYFFIHVKGESDVLLESIKKTEIISILTNTVKSTLPRVFEIDITNTVTQVTKNPTLVRQVIFEEVSSPKSCKVEYTKASEPIKVYIHNEDVVDEFAKTILDVYGGKKSRRICSLKSADEIEDAIFMREVLMSDNTTPLFVAEVEFVNPYSLSSVRKNMSISNSTIFLLGKKGSDGLRIEIEEITSIKCSSQCDDLFVMFCGDSAYLFNSELKTKIIETLRAANSKIQILVEPKLIIPFKDLFVWDGEMSGSSSESLPSLIERPVEVEEPMTPPSTPSTHFLESPLVKKKGTNGYLIIVVLVDRNISEPKIMCNNEQANAKLTIRINDQDPAFPFYPLFSKSKKV